MLYPKISVIVPIYNVEKYLPHCIDSIIAQTFTDFELLLIDDGSKDMSSVICDKYAEKDSRIRVFHKENGGVSSARNVGIKKSVGNFLCFIDADDILQQNALTDLYNCIVNNKADFSLGSCYKLKAGKLYPFISNENKLYINDFSINVSHYALWGYLFRSSIIIQNNILFDEELSYSEDRIFIYKYMMYSHSMSTCSNYVYQYRINHESACFSSNTMKKVTSQLNAIERMRFLEKKCSRSLSLKLRREEKDVLLLGLRQFMEYDFNFKDFFCLFKIFLKIKDNTLADDIIFFYYSIKTFISRKLRSTAIRRKSSKIAIIS